MAERNEPIISFRDFSFQYRAQKRPTLTGIDLDIYPGERVLIAGPSASVLLPLPEAEPWPLPAKCPAQSSFASGF